ncbi:hypothetical protein [Phycisphaera mikurensis]|uniref:Lipoprotein n=1 Tax=Phycisphaera mikurensis (strain NBRC 102666 / KCTC 22515 / FYK2301M01) TaxID=1142394 RepID=I0IBG0_PHYMF|nr:hypothetical protein [Phycisphaera mikurensis]MBB6442869.1 hypothetical protein [Phycisphaera mikurensis]BAM02598.1 hypothetical protein PSMK_04390 [Phycisphaera mikurensis NBRC 102666]
MPMLLPRILLFVSLVAACGCRNPLPAFPGAAASDPAAKAVLERSAEAHGGLDAYERVDGVAVGFAGEWLGGIHRFQPVLVDRGFRQVSRERYVFRDADGEPLPHPVVGQRHDGEAGTKWVRWQGREVPVGIAYRGRDGEPVAPHPEARAVTESSALVAEAYRMFLTGPFFFLERDARADAETAYAPAERAEVGGVACEQVLVRIRPGFGLSEEDRVLVAVGRDDGLLRRVRFSLDGFSGTGGAVADVVFADWIRRGGLRWPTRFLETVTFPLNRDVHAWEMIALSVARDGSGTGPAAAGIAELTPAHWSPRAAGRTRPVRVTRGWQAEDWPAEVREDLPAGHPGRALER